ncbi:MAG: hypothetical protein ACXVII_45695 [Solirubrobacteraceae bacterium]
MCVRAAGGTVNRRVLFRAAAVGYVASVLNGSVGMAARIASLRRSASQTSPRVPGLMAAEVPIITVELALVAIFSFTLIAPLGVPWWVPVIVVGVAGGLVAALLRRVSERRRTGVWAGLAILGQELSDQQAVVIEKPRWNLTIFKVHFGHLTLKAYTKGERVLRFEAIAHHAKQLGYGRRLDKFPEITARLTGMVDRFTNMLDCVEIGFLPDGILDQLPAPSTLGATRTGGIDINIPRIRAALAAGLALAVPRKDSPSPSSPSKFGRSPESPPTATASARAPTTCASYAANSSSSNPGAPAATTYPRPARAPSPPCRHSARRSSRRSSPGSARQDEADHPKPGPTSTATTKPSASTCKPCSTTSASRPRLRPHRQRSVDRVPQPSR